MGCFWQPRLKKISKTIDFNFWVKYWCIVPKLHFFWVLAHYILFCPGFLPPSLSPPVQNFTAITATHFVAMPKISQNLKQRRPFGGRLGDRPSRRRVPSLSRKSKRGFCKIAHGVVCRIIFVALSSQTKRWWRRRIEPSPKVRSS